jgi:hypothetical protein
MLLNHVYIVWSEIRRFSAQHFQHFYSNLGYIAQASDDVFQNLKRQYSPTFFKEEHLTQSQRAIAIEMLLECCYSQETRRLENRRKLYQVYAGIQKVYVPLCIVKFVAHASFV